MNNRLKNKEENTLSVFVFDAISVSDDYKERNTLVTIKSIFPVFETINFVNELFSSKIGLANSPNKVTNLMCNKNHCAFMV